MINMKKVYVLILVRYLKQYNIAKKQFDLTLKG